VTIFSFLPRTGLFALVALAATQVISVKAAEAVSCKSLFESKISEDPLTAIDSIFFPLLLKDVRHFSNSGLDGSGVFRNLTDTLSTIPESHDHFSFFGQSVSRFYASQLGSKPALSTLITNYKSTGRDTQSLGTLVEKLFRSGYELSSGGKFRPESHDVDALMIATDVAPLTATIRSNRKNLILLESYFKSSRPIPGSDRPASAVSPLETNAFPRGFRTADYGALVTEKIRLLRSVQIEDPNIFSGMPSVAWTRASSAERTRIAKFIFETESGRKSINTPINLAGISNLKPLMFAIGLKDQVLVDLFVKHGADTTVTTPANVPAHRLDAYNIIPGESAQAMALRLGIHL